MQIKKRLSFVVLFFLLFSNNVSLSTATPNNNKQLTCLAENIYHEAKNQSTMGKVGVAFVTLNRTFSSQYPNDICKVVYQKYNDICQFSWVCENKTIKDSAAYREAKKIARMVYTNYNTMLDPTEGAYFFHAHYVKPSWAKKHKKTIRIDDHIFYKPRNT